MRRSLALLLAFAPIAASVTCRNPTEVTLELSTDVACEAQGSVGEGVAIDTAIYSSDGPNTFGGGPSAETGACGSADATGVHRIGSIVLVPSGSKDAAFGIEAIAALGGMNASACKAFFDGAGDGGADPAIAGSCIKETRRLDFIPHDDSRTLEVLMPDACRGRVCPDGTPCALDGSCVNDHFCPPTGPCVPPEGDGGEPGDGGSDAGPNEAGPFDAGTSFWSRSFPQPSGASSWMEACRPSTVRTSQA